MTEMLVPTTSAMIRCIGDCLDNTIAPALTQPVERSALTTVRHLLRLLDRRIEAEGQVLWDEDRRLRRLLPQAAEYADSRIDGRGLASQIRAALVTSRDPNVYPSLTILATEIGALRGYVVEALKLLRSAGSTAYTSGTGSAGGDALHTAIREYIVWQIEQEGRVVEPAFRGQGPRR